MIKQYLESLLQSEKEKELLHQIIFDDNEKTLNQINSIVYFGIKRQEALSKMNPREISILLKESLRRMEQ